MKFLKDKSNNFLINFSKIMIILVILYTILLFFNKTLNFGFAIRNTVVIILFLGIFLFYRFYRKIILLYMGYIFLILSICLSFFLITVLDLINFSTIIIFITSIYFFFQINIYLYHINDNIYLNILAFLLFFNKNYKYKLAWNYYNSNNYKKVLKKLKNLKTYDALYLLASTYEKVFEYNKAIEIYSNMLNDKKNEHLNILYNRGALYKKMGKYFEAMDDFATCINCQTPDPKSFIALGIIKHELGEFKEARIFFNKAKLIDKTLSSFIPNEYK